MRDSESIILAKRYAKAITAAIADKSSYEDFHSSLKDFLSSLKINGNESILKKLSAPIVSLSEIGAFMSDFKEKSNEDLYKVMTLLASDKRLVLLPNIYEELETLRLEREGVEPVVVYSAVALSKAQSESVKSKVEKLLNKSVVLDFIVDKSVVGGLKFRFKSSLVDDSVGSKISSLKEQLLA